MTSKRKIGYVFKNSRQRVYYSSTRSFLSVHPHPLGGNSHGERGTHMEGGTKAEHADLEEERAAAEAASDSPNHGGDLDTKV